MADCIASVLWHPNLWETSQKVSSHNVWLNFTRIIYLLFYLILKSCQICVVTFFIFWLLNVCICKTLAVFMQCYSLFSHDLNILDLLWRSPLWRLPLCALLLCFMIYYDITMGHDIARDATMGTDIARDIHCDVTMGNDIAVCTYNWQHNG